MKFRPVPLFVAGAMLLASLSAGRADQSSIAVPIVGPVSPPVFAAAINSAHQALATHHSGTAAPANGPSGAIAKGWSWLDTSVTPNLLKLYDGSSWATVGRLDTTLHAFTTASRATHGDSNYTIVVSDLPHLALSASLTAPRTWTLPLAGAVPAGSQLTILDGGGINGANTLTIQRNGTDSLFGIGVSANAITFSTAFEAGRFVSDGATSWSYVDGVPTTHFGSTVPIIFGGTGASTLSGAQTNLGAPSYPVLYPGEVGTCAPAHSLLFNDQIQCWTGPTIYWTSSDYSAEIDVLTIGGTKTTGDVLNLKFEFGAGTCAGPTGCTVSYTVLAGDTMNTLATGIVNAIKADSRVYNQTPGAQGQITNPQIVNNDPSTKQIGISWNGNVSMKLTASVTGAGTETLTLPVDCATSCTKNLNAGPTFFISRNPGRAPAANSVAFTLQSFSTTSTSPTTIAQIYGSITNNIINSTSGAIAASWALTVPDTAGTINSGLFISSTGIYTASAVGGAKGIDTINAPVLWTQGSAYTRVTSGVVEFYTAGGVVPLRFGVNDAAVFGIESATTVLPITDNTKDFGSAAKRWANVLAVGGTFTNIIAKSTINIGETGVGVGELRMLGTSGTVTVKSQAAAGTYNFNLPTAAGTAGQPMLSGGGGAAAMSFATLGIPGGGTGFASYTVGDVLVADTTTSFTRRAAVATGSVLMSQGVGAVSIWSATPTLSGSLQISPNLGAPNAGILLTVNKNGAGSPLPAPTFAGAIAQFGGADATASRIYNDAFGSNAGIHLRRINGTLASPSQVLNGEIIGGIFYEARDTAGFNSTDTAGFYGIASENQTTTGHGTNISIRTVPNGTLSTVQAAMFYNSGGFSVGNITTDPGAGSFAQTGGHLAYSATGVPAGGTAGVGYKFSTTTNLGLFFGSGAPTLSAAKGSIYIRTDGTTTNDRFYINTNGSTAWAAGTTAS